MASINNRLQISTKQNLVLNNKMLMSLEILYMSTADLNEHIKQQLIENPFLESNSSYDSYDYKNQVKNKSTTDILEQTIDSKNESLFEYLIEQVNITNMNENQKYIAQILIGYIDNDGYIKTTTTKISEENNIDLANTEYVLSIIQTFEPLGIASNNLEQALITQLKRNNSKYKDIAINIIEKYFNELIDYHYNIIIDKLSITIDDIEKARELISKLEPYPARAFDNSHIEYVVPELFIFKENGKWTVKTNDKAIPHLQINKKYTRLKEGTKDKDTLLYLKEQEEKASNLIRFLSDRGKTLYKVGQALVDLQIEFFENGKESIVPLRLKDIALYEKVNVSESTISRLVNRKYLETVWGIFPLKYFFSSVIGSSMSSRSVKEMIKRIISNSTQSLSDEKIKNILMAEGVSIARRTVSKYRSQLKIPSSRNK